MKNKKVILGVLAILVVVAVAVFASNPAMFQGMTRLETPSIGTKITTSTVVPTYSGTCPSSNILYLAPNPQYSFNDLYNVVSKNKKSLKCPWDIDFSYYNYTEPGAKKFDHQYIYEMICKSGDLIAEVENGDKTVKCTQNIAGKEVTGIIKNNQAVILERTETTSIQTDVSVVQIYEVGPSMRFLN